MTYVLLLLQRRIPVGFDFHTRWPLSVRALLDDISHRHQPTPYLEKMAATVGLKGTAALSGCSFSDDDSCR